MQDLNPILHMSQIRCNKTNIKLMPTSMQRYFNETEDVLIV